MPQPVTPQRPPALRHALGIQRDDAAWLRAALPDAAITGQAVPIDADAWGTYWRMDGVVRTLWIVRTADDLPRLVTCWVV